jgi:hypothetical protein
VNPTPLTRFCGLKIEGSTWILHPSQGSVASGSKDPRGSYTPHKVLWPQDRKIHLDPTPLTGFWGLRIEGSTWILHPSQGSGASESKDPPVSYTSHMVLWPRDRRIHLDPILSQGSVASGSKDPRGSYTLHKVLWPQDRRIHPDPTPLTRVLWPQGRRIRVDPIPLTGFCGVRIEGSTWILHPSQGSVASGSKDPPGSYTPHKVLSPQDRRIHLDPTHLTEFCGLRRS